MWLLVPSPIPFVLLPSPAETDVAAWQDDVCRYQRPELPRVEAPTAAPPIVLLPGFGNCTQDYVAPFGDEEAGVAAVLQVAQEPVYTVGGCACCEGPCGWPSAASALLQVCELINLTLPPCNQCA